MYIQSIDIKNIRVLANCKINFAEPAGWHVIIGDNGTGKSTLMRAISLGLIGPVEAKALRSDFTSWIRHKSESAEINLTLLRDGKFDGYSGRKRPLKKPFNAQLKFARQQMSTAFSYVEVTANHKAKLSPDDYVWSNQRGWFSAGFGSFRRLHGGDTSLNKIFHSSPKAASHFSLFNEDLALTEAITWLRDNDYRRLKYEEAELKQPGDSELFEKTRTLINSEGLLPHGAKLVKMSPDGPIFEDANGYRVDVVQMSDGFRSILSIAFELIRQLVEVYGFENAFRNVHGNEEKVQITVPGVVLIDEVDAHLHPTWQRDIGKWFTTCFPNIQFIVTTHSPLVCWAASKGSIFWLATPGSNEISHEIIGLDRERLIYGNLLEALGTDAFGERVSRSAESANLLHRLGELTLKSMRGEISLTEEEEMYKLRAVLPTGHVAISQKQPLR